MSQEDYPEEIRTYTKTGCRSPKLTHLGHPEWCLVPDSQSRLASQLPQ